MTIFTCPNCGHKYSLNNICCRCNYEIKVNSCKDCKYIKKFFIEGWTTPEKHVEREHKTKYQCLLMKDTNHNSCELKDFEVCGLYEPAIDFRRSR